MRAILLTGRESVAQSDPSIFECTYAPHSRIFPNAAAIIHHGGIGTTGQALRAGKPQLVVPHMGDQNDHARRIVQLGVGLTIKPVRFTINEAIAVLSTLLSNQDIRYEAMRIGAFIAAEDAPAAATSFIAQELRRHADAKAVCKHGQPLRGRPLYIVVCWRGHINATDWPRGFSDEHFSTHCCNLAGQRACQPEQHDARTHSARDGK
jgi:hypothetical protein